jgi:uncharacterized protein
MRIILAGGTGLIGRVLVAELLDGGHELFVLSRSPRSSSTPGVTMVQWDSQTSNGWGHLVEEAGAVVNLAGENIGSWLWTPRRKREIVASRIKAGQAVVEAVQQASNRPRMVLQASAIGYYGAAGDRILTENDPPAGDFLGQVCSLWEGASKAVVDLGVRYVISRTGLVISPKGGFMDPVLLQYRLLGGGPLGGGRQWWSWIHLRDVARAMRFLIESEHASGAYNVTGPEPLRMTDFGRVVGRVLRRPHYFPVPAFALKLVLGEMSQLVLDSQRVLPERLQAAGFNFLYTDLKPALVDTLKGGD